MLEVVAGRWTHSLALQSDAGHLGTDAATLGLVLYALARSRRPATARHTYGFHRSGIVVAGVNGLALFGISAAIAIGAIGRLSHPEPIDGVPVIAVATLALVVNIALLLMLSGRSHELSVHSAVLHIAADSLASLSVIVAAVVILTTGWTEADALVSLGIAFLISIGAVGLLLEATAILSEAAPRDLDTNAIRLSIETTAGVEDVHDLHIWSLSRAHRVLSAHVTVGDRPLGEVTMLLREIELRLCSDYGIEHATLQPECPSCASHATRYCDLDERHANHSH